MKDFVVTVKKHEKSYPWTVYYTVDTGFDIKTFSTLADAKQLAQYIEQQTANLYYLLMALQPWITSVAQLVMEPQRKSVVPFICIADRNSVCKYRRESRIFGVSDLASAYIGLLSQIADQAKSLKNREVYKTAHALRLLLRTLLRELIVICSPETKIKDRLSEFGLD